MMSEIYVAVAALIGAAFGAFFSSCLKRKGENYATKEDFEKILEQVKKTTHETESIKVELSRGNWINQQQWMLRERYYAGLLDGLYTLKSSLESLQTWYIEPGSEHRDTEFEKTESFQKMLGNARRALGKIKELHGPAELVISGPAINALEDFYDEYWSASEFSMCNSDWLERAYGCAQKAHSEVLRQAKLQLVPDLH